MTLVLKIEVYEFSFFFLALHALPSAPVFSFPELFAAWVLMVLREGCKACNPGWCHSSQEPSCLRGTVGRSLQQQTLHPGCPERGRAVLRAWKWGASWKLLEDRAAGELLCRQTPALLRVAWERTDTYVLIWRASRSSLAPAAPALVSFVMFTFLVTSH